MKNSLIEHINKKIEQKGILKHPFYADWKSGKLTKKMLKVYAKQYYKHVAAFPRYLSALHSKIEDFGDRQMVLQNLMDEEHGKKNHIDLWLNFGSALGLSKKEIRSATASKETSAFVNHFISTTANKSIAEGVAALYAYESQIPGVSHEKIQGLIKFYGVETKDGLEYFNVHKLADLEHSAAERKLIEKYAKTPESRKKVLQAVDKTLDNYWGMLSGVQKFCSEC